MAVGLLLPFAALAAGPQTTGPAGEAVRITRWEAGKHGLEAALPPGRSRAFYREELSRLGYRVRWANEAKPDCLEYEVFSGAYRYDVYIDVDQESSMATNVQVAPNLLKARASRSAVDRSRAWR